MRVVRAGVLVTFSLVGCLDPTQATIEVTTNVDCGGEDPSPAALFETGILAGPPTHVEDGELATTTRTCDATSGRVGSVVVFPRNGAERAGVLVIGTVGDVTAESCLERVRSGATDLAGCIVARRTVAFVPHKDLAVSVFLDGRCEGVACGAGQTCAFADGKPTCVTDEVTCVGTECEVAGATTSSAGGASGTGGAAGSGGASGTCGGAPIPIFTPLPLPVGLLEAGAFGVSEDGAIVAGSGVSVDDLEHPVVWRGSAGFTLSTARGSAAEACGFGDLVVGSLTAGTQNAAAWQWNAGTQAYETVWAPTPMLVTNAADCNVTGSRILATGGAGFSLFALGAPTPFVSVSGGAFAISGNGTVVVGAEPGTNRPVYWNVSGSGVLSPPIALSASVGQAYAVNATGTLIAVATADGLALYQPGSSSPVFDKAMDFAPSALAGSATDYLVAGSCDPFVKPRACVVVDGAGPFDIDGRQGTPWPTTSAVDFGGLELESASDVTATGKTLVGSAMNPATSRRVAYRLRLP